MAAKLQLPSKATALRARQQEAEVQLHALVHRILVVQTTTSAVELLLHGQYDTDPKEIITCMVQNIADELGQMSEVGEILIATLTEARRGTAEKRNL
jgi:hypothetical protein